MSGRVGMHEQPMGPEQAQQAEHKKNYQLQDPLVPTTHQWIRDQGFFIPNLTNAKKVTGAHDCALIVIVRMFACLGSVFRSAVRRSMTAMKNTNNAKYNILGHLRLLLRRGHVDTAKNTKGLREISGFPANEDLSITRVFRKIIDALMEPEQRRFRFDLDTVAECPNCTHWISIKRRTNEVYFWATEDLNYTKEHDVWQEEDLKFDKQPQWPNSFEPIAYSPDRGTLRVCPNCKDIKPDGQNFPLVLKKKQKRKAKSSITKKQKQAKPSTAKQQQQRAKPSTAKTQQPQQEEEPEASTSKQAEQASTSEQAVADDDPRLQCGLKERLTTAHATLNAPRSTRYLVVVPYVKIEDPSKPNGHKVNRVKLDQLRVTPHERQRFHGFWELDHTTNKYTFNTTQQKEYRLVGYSLYSRKDYEHVVWRCSMPNPDDPDSPYFLHCDDDDVFTCSEEDYHREAQSIQMLLYETVVEVVKAPTEGGDAPTEGENEPMEGDDAPTKSEDEPMEEEEDEFEKERKKREEEEREQREAQDAASDDEMNVLQL